MSWKGELKNHQQTPQWDSDPPEGRVTCSLNCWTAFAIFFTPSSRVLQASSILFWICLLPSHFQTTTAAAEPQSRAKAAEGSTSLSGRSCLRCCWIITWPSRLRGWSEKQKRPSLLSLLPTPLSQISKQFISLRLTSAKLPSVEHAVEND